MFIVMSYNCINYNCDDDLGSHTLNDCGAHVFGGYPNVIILECVHSITDPSNATQVQDAIDAGEAHLVKNVSVELPVGSATKVDSVIANEPQIVTRYEFSGTLRDPNVSSANVTFYNNLTDGRTMGGIIFHNEREGKVYWHDAAVRFEGSIIMPINDQAPEIFETVFTFKKNLGSVNPAIYTEPAGIFS